MAEIAPHIPLCLSHWCDNPNAKTRKTHKVHTAIDGNVIRLADNYIHGERSGWFLAKPLSGKLREIIIESGGSVCVPQNMVTRKLVENYHADEIEVSTFSYLDWDHIKEHKKRFDIDLFFIDNKDVFDEG